MFRQFVSSVKSSTSLGGVVDVSTVMEHVSTTTCLSFTVPPNIFANSWIAKEKKE